MNYMAKGLHFCASQYSVLHTCGDEFLVKRTVAEVNVTSIVWTLAHTYLNASARS